MRRVVYQRLLSARTASANHEVARSRKKVLLIGAGEAGLQVLRALRMSDSEVVGFLDDELTLQGRSIGGWPVLGATRDLESVVAKFRIAEVDLLHAERAQGRAENGGALRRDSCQSLIGARTVGNHGRQGHDSRSSFREHGRSLGRTKITHPQDAEEVSLAFRGARILVTGAGGSIGSELVRQLRGYEPSQLILLDKDENNLYEVACEIKEDFPHVTEVVGDIRDWHLMSLVFERFAPEVVFHAAAYKHVPLMEHHPAEAILNNVIGTKNLVEISNKLGVKSFVMISTDKAVNPSSIMGASKRVAEMIVQDFAARGTQTRFCCVRFGNVLGSRASVVSLFQRQIKQRRNITVTHPDVRRYFMTIPEAVQLVIKAGSFGDHGEIMMLDMGDPVKIIDLAHHLVELSGLEPGRDVKIEFTGLRPGEKLNEELLAPGEWGVQSARYAKIFVIESPPRDGFQLKDAVKNLERAARDRDGVAIRGLLTLFGIGYHEEVPVVHNGAASTPTDEETTPQHA